VAEVSDAIVTNRNRLAFCGASEACTGGPIVLAKRPVPTENLKNGLNSMFSDLSELSAGTPSYSNAASRLGDPLRLGSRGLGFEKDSHNSAFGLSPSEAGDASFGFTELCPNSALPAQTQKTGKKAGKFERGPLPGQ
jgi:hypothetical protein